MQTIDKVQITRSARKAFFEKYGIPERAKGQRYDKDLLPGGIFDLDNLSAGQRTIENGIVDTLNTYLYGGWGDIQEAQIMIIRNNDMLVPAYRLKSIGGSWCIICQDRSHKAIKESK